ncbi:MAG TPA: hypothetical protein VD794_01525 [Flavisolibacter sp.]|nr:hypothetical protein [Flavisolibacter sp.]
MLDRNQQKGYAEPDKNNQWERSSNTEESKEQQSDENAVIWDDVATTDEPLDDGTVAVGSGLGIDE